MAESGLEALARGLRGAGGILSPEVQKMEQQDQQQQNAVAEQRRNMLAQMTIKGAEAGSIDPVKATETLRGLGLDVPAGAIGPTPEAMAKKQAYEQDVQFRDAWTRLDPNASLAERASVAARYGKPDLSIQLYTKHEDRVTKAQERKDLLEQRSFEFTQKLEDKNLDRESRERIAAANDETRRQIGMMQGEIAKGRQELLSAKAAEGQDKALGTQTQKLGQALEKANLPEADATLGQVEKMLRTNPELASWITGPKSAVPDMMAPQEVREARQAFNKLFNMTLKLRSGAAVTQQELDRLKSEFGVGVSKDPQQVEAAVKQARSIITKHYKSVAAGYGPAVLKRYNENVRGLGGGSVVDVEAADDPLGLR